MSDRGYAQKTFLGHIPASSWTRRFHPVTRLATFLCFSCLPLLISIPEINLLIFTVHVGLLLSTNVNSSIFYRFIPVLVTMATFMTIVAVSTASASAPHQTAVSCATDIQTQLIITLNAYVRIVAMFSATLFYFATNTEREFLSAFRLAGLPYVPTYVLGLSIRSAALLSDDLRSIREAEKGRGADNPRFAPFGRLKKMFSSVVPLFAISIRRIEEISDALFCRGFTLFESTAVSARYPGYIATGYRLAPRDFLTLGLLLVLVLLTVKLSFFDRALALQASPVANSWLCHTRF